MRTPAQIEASRRNGAQSRGPVTPQGKAVSSLNATRHGLLARSVLLGGEDPALFRSLLEDLVRRYRPADNVELGYVEQIAAASWRLRRAELLETAVLNRRIRVPIDDPMLARLAEHTRDLELLHRHQERLARAGQRAVNALLRLRKHCPLPDPDPGPVPVPAPAPAPAPAAAAPAQAPAAAAPAAAQPASAGSAPWPMPR